MRHKDYKFKGRHYSARAFIALFMGVITVGGYIAMAVFSGLHGGNAKITVGVLGMICFAVSVAGFILAIKSLRERDIYYSFSVAGIVLNGLALLTYFISYILGIAG